MPSSDGSQTFAHYVRETGARLTTAAPKVTTRREALKRPRDQDTGHVIIGIGYAFTCSCGATGSRRRSYREAMNEGREHAAAHTAEASADV